MPNRVCRFLAKLQMVVSDPVREQFEHVVSVGRRGKQGDDLSQRLLEKDITRLGKQGS